MTTDTKASEATPYAYAYRYFCPFGDRDIIVIGNAGPWNGQKPREAVPLYWGPDFDALQRERDALKAENERLRNLVNNLQPGPISEALVGERYARESELKAESKRLRQHLASETQAAGVERTRADVLAERVRKLECLLQRWLDPVVSGSFGLRSDTNAALQAAEGEG